MFISERTASFLEVSSTVELCGRQIPSSDCLPPDIRCSNSNCPRNDALVKAWICKKGKGPWV